MLSISQPGLKFEDVEGTRAMLRYTNEYGAQLVRDHKGRFGLMATLPLADIDGSLREMEYALDTLKADGINLLTSYGNRYPGNPYFDPVFEELNRRKATVFFHPNMPACCIGILPDVPGPTIEYQFNTARAVTNLLYTGTLSRFPDIKYIFCHAGGALIPQVGRVVRHATESKKIAAKLPNGPWAEIKKLYFDTAQASDPWNFGATRTFMPITQLLLGSDYPFIQVSDTVDSLLKLGLSDADLRAVTRDNALALFPRLRRVIVIPKLFSAGYLAPARSRPPAPACRRRSAAGHRHQRAVFAGEAAQAHLGRTERAGIVARRAHAGLHARDQFGVFLVDLAVDAPVEITRRLHLAARIGMHIGDLADHGLVRRDRQELHEVDLVGIDIERVVGPELEIDPQPLPVRRQVRHRRQILLIHALGAVGRGSARK